jgi:hypothetical protein
LLRMKLEYIVQIELYVSIVQREIMKGEMVDV